MPRVVLPADIASGTEIVLDTGEIARVEGRVDANRVRVRMADGSERVVERTRADVRPRRERNEERRARVEAHRSGYRRFSVRWFDGQTVKASVFGGTEAQREATDFARGKGLYGEAAEPEEVEP